MASWTSLQPTFEQCACKASAWFASPLAVVGFPVVSLVWIAVGFGVNSLTLTLSILAISATQLVLVGQARDARAVKAEIDEILRAIPGADDSVALDD